jgi:hypothetical protein
MTLRVGVLVVVLGIALYGCASKSDVTPPIAISPNVKGRLMLMDRFRHTSDGRPRLPHVTVEEVDEDDLLFDEPTSPAQPAAGEIDAAPPKTTPDAR